MQLIWVSGPTARLQTFSITALKAVVSVSMLASALVLLGFLCHWIGLRMALQMAPSWAQSRVGLTSDEAQFRLEAGYREKLESLTAQYKNLLLSVQRLEMDKNEIFELNKIEALRKQHQAGGTPPTDGRGGPFKAIDLDDFKRSTLDEGMDAALQDADHLKDALGFLHQKWRREIDWLKTMPTGLPIDVNARVSSTFGLRLDPLTHRPSRHEGLDFVGPLGTPVVASAPGVVTRSEWSGAYGNLVEVAHAQGFHSRYAHLNERKVAEGDKITRGSEVGTLGSTGRSTGPHLHYEIVYKDEAINPTRIWAVLRK
jgi:murein DD-endopeptidase MepM/ murein hydrolase activator NlpD